MTRARTAPPVSLSAALLGAALAWTTAAVAADSDGDGVDDAVDAAPCDASASAVSFYPSETQSALLAFEDQWPHQTDLDFNDVVVRAHYRFEREASGRVARVVLMLDPVALGGRIDNGLGLVLPVSRASVTARRRVGAGAWTALTLEGDADASVRLSPNLRELFGNTAGQINAGTAAAQTGARLEVELTIGAPASLSAGLAPFDLFIFRTQDFGHQIHFPPYDGTDAFAAGLFGAGEDGSTAARHFVNGSGIPAALSLVTAAYYPLEGVAISELFPDIVTFAATEGASAQSFYLTNVRPAAGLAVGAGTVAAIVADSSCTIRPAPIADAVAPDTIANATGDVSVTVSGSGFVSTSVVRLGATPLATTWVSSTQLTAVVPLSMLTASWTYELRVDTPAPGGGTSAGLALTSMVFSQSAPLASCEAVRAAGGIGNGVFWLDPDGDGPIASFTAYCDQRTDGGGWMLVLYARGPVTAAAYSTTLGQSMVRGEALHTATQDAAGHPVAPDGLVNQYGEVLFRGGDATWQSTMGAWVRAATFPVGTTAPSVTYSGVLSASGRTAAYHQRRGWGDTTVALSDTLSWWDANGLSPICGGANTPAGKHCPFFDQSQAGYPYHYDTSNDRELYVRGPLGNPTPTITAASPSGVVVGAPATPVTVTGASFVRGATILLDGAALATTYVSSTQLTATLPASTFASAGSHSVAVRQPAPGGGTTGALSISVGTLGSPGFAAGSCADLYAAGVRADGRYSVLINGVVTTVYCDLNTDGGGWMLVYYVGSTVTTAHNLTVGQIAIRGQAMATVTTDATNRPVPPTGLTNTFNQVLYRGGTATWRANMGDWVRFATFAPGTSASATFGGVNSSLARTALYAAVRGWGGTTVAATDVFTLWNANGISGICGGANTPGSRNCPFFNQSQAGYPYHYDTGSSPRELYVR